MVWYDYHDNYFILFYGIMITNHLLWIINYYNKYDSDCYGMIMINDTCNIL